MASSYFYFLQKNHAVVDNLHKLLTLKEALVAFDVDLEALQESDNYPGGLKKQELEEQERSANSQTNHQIKREMETSTKNNDSNHKDELVLLLHTTFVGPICSLEALYY